MMDSGIKERVKISEDVDFEIEEGNLEVRGPNGELSRLFDLELVELDEDDGDILVVSGTSRKEACASVGTVVSHINNMIEGVTDGFSSKLKVVYSHFPIKVNVDNNKVKIENFIGEEKPRVAEIVGDTEVKINGEEIEVTGPDKEDVGQTSANIEQATHSGNRDPRVFQDGVYIVERP